MTEQFSFASWCQAEVEKDRRAWWLVFLVLQFCLLGLMIDSFFITNFVSVMQKQIHPV